MKKAVWLLSLFLCALALVCSPLSARAAVVSLRVTVTGETTAPDGTALHVPLEGAFRVLQNGQDAGILRTGEPMTLTDGERVRLEPLPETFQPGWDLSGAYATPDLSAGGEVTVALTLRPLPAYTEDVPTPESVPMPEQTATEAPADALETQALAEDAGQVSAQAEPTPGAFVTPTIPPYHEEDTTTPEPPLPELPEGENTGSLRLWVFNDKNDNGKLGLSEPGIPGLTVYLLQESGEAVAASVTDDEGEVYFTNIPEGRYRTRVFLPVGWNFTHFGGKDDLEANAYQFSTEDDQISDVLTISAGKEALQGVGIRTAYYVSGYCWLDESGDGLYKQGEAMIPGVRITMTRESDNLYYETVSKADGSWRIDRVRPGLYTITAWAPDGMMFAKYTSSRGIRSILTRDGVAKASTTMNLNDNQSKTDQYIGFTWAGKITGKCYLDANYNGLYDEGEEPMPGVKVAAAKQSAQDDEIAVAFSDEEGNFVLTGLRGNTYRIRAVMPEDGSTFTTTVLNDPMGNHFKSRPDRRENFWNDFTLRDAETREIAIGAIYPAMVKGTVYMDDDFSATMNGKEKIVSGFLVVLKDLQGNTAAMDKTSVKGVYELTGITPGDYTLSVTAVSGYAFTRAGEGNVILNKTGGEGYSEPFHVALGEKITGKDIGMIRPGTVKGAVFADLNDNGLRDGGEEGLPGVTVRLINEEDGTEAFSAEIGTDSRFLFDAVMPGHYHLEYTLPSNAVFARETAGGNSITAGDGGIGRGASFAFATGDTVEAPLCGALTLGRIEGTAYRDHDGNGMQEAEEPLAGLTVRLIPSRPELEEMTAVSGEDGSFALENLRPDTYTLQAVCPEGYVLSRTDHLALPLTAGKTDQRVSLDVPMGAVREKQQIGAVQPASIRGRLWLDENDNGLFDEGERTPAGYTVTVTDDSTGRAFDTPVTDEDGFFSASGMIPGRFSLYIALDDSTLAPKAGDSMFKEENGSLVLASIVLEENEVRESLLAGIIRHTEISGHAWIDRGGAIENLSGVQVTLTDADGNAVQTTTTDGSGRYLFEHLMPGSFRLDVTVPEGCVIIEPGDPRLGGELRSVITKTVNRVGSSDLMELWMDQPWTDMNIGSVLPGRLGDYCWLDLDGDGLQGAGEPGIANVRIELLRDGEVLAETVTDQYGFYRFEDLYPAEYTLRVYAPAEVKPTVRRTDLKIIASVLEESEDSTALSVPVTVESNRAMFDADLGFVCRQPGVLPAGAGAGRTMDWSK